MRPVKCATVASSAAIIARRQRVEAFSSVQDQRQHPFVEGAENKRTIVARVGHGILLHGGCYSVDWCSRLHAMKLVPFLLIALLGLAQAQSSGGLRIYVIDVEGGGATLVIAPS